jgi:sec-independent protein translocase protein TatB
MLDFGFSEILLTSAIALIVLGPERLPKVARQVGNWMGRARIMARQLSEQLEREVNAEALLKEQSTPMKPPSHSVAAPAAPTALTAVPPPLPPDPIPANVTSAATPDPSTAMSAEPPPPEPPAQAPPAPPAADAARPHND